ncbi:MAG: hypothetical protein JNK04_24495 [Myxococcales bacterium]|nr:hypothetical protein [Myxococcales bacterium]
MRHLAVPLVILGFACSSSETGDGAPTTSSSAQRQPPRAVAQVPLPARPAADPNPLGLPARKLELAVGARVFAVPEAMLRGAKEGSSFQLRATTVTGKDGDNLVLDGREGPDYSIHPAYVVPIQSVPRPRLNAPVAAEFAGVLRHGVVRKYVKDKIVVRFTDTNDKGERTLESAQLMPLSDGFRAANYAVRKSPGIKASEPGADYEHLLLVSPIGGAEQKDATEWLALGYGGAVRRVQTSELLAVPVSYEPKEGARVWVEHLGRMREGAVRDVDKPGLMTVRFERAGRPVQVGWGLVMPPANAGPGRR